MKTLQIKAYNLEPHHIATINQVAKDNGESSRSAALRFIIDEWARLNRTSTLQVVKEPAR